MPQQNILCHLLCHFFVVSGVMTLNATSSTSTSPTATPSVVITNTSVTASLFSAVQTSSLSSAVPSVASNTLSAAPGAKTKGTAPSSQTPPRVLPSSSTGHVSSASPSTSPTTSPAAIPSATVTNANNGRTTTSPAKDVKDDNDTTVAGFVIAFLVIFAVVVATLYWISRPKKMNTEKGNEFEMDASALCGSAATGLGHTKEPEVGINHQAFVADSENPENVAAPNIHEVKVAVEANFSYDTAF